MSIASLNKVTIIGHRDNKEAVFKGKVKTEASSRRDSTA